MVYQATLPWRAPTPHELLARELAGTCMTSKQCKKLYRERTRVPKQTREEQRLEIQELHRQLRLDDEKEKKRQRLERNRVKRQEKAAKAREELEALRRRPGPMPAKWAADEPKCRITDFFRVSAPASCPGSKTEATGRVDKKLR